MFNLENCINILISQYCIKICKKLSSSRILKKEHKVDYYKII